MIRCIVDLSDARHVPSVQNTDSSAQHGRYDAQFAIVAGCDDGQVGMVNLFDILDIVPVIHVLEGLDQVSELCVLADFFLSILVKLLDEGPLDLVLPRVIHTRLITSTSIPEYLAFGAIHLFV